MKATDKKALSMFRRVEHFLRADTPGEPLATPVRELIGVIERFEMFAQRQEEHQRRMKSLTAALQHQSRKVRNEHLKAIALAARTVLSGDSQEAQVIEQAIRLPRYRADYEQVIAAARAVAETAGPWQARIAAAGLGPDFITALRREADALVAALGVRAQELERRVAATRGVDDEARRGVALVRLLDVLVRPPLAGNASKLAEWERVIRRTRPPAAPEVEPVVASGGEPAVAA